MIITLLACQALTVRLMKKNQTMIMSEIQGAIFRELKQFIPTVKLIKVRVLHASIIPTIKPTSITSLSPLLWRN